MKMAIRTAVKPQTSRLWAEAVRTHCISVQYRMHPTRKTQRCRFSRNDYADLSVKPVGSAAAQMILFGAAEASEPCSVSPPAGEKEEEQPLDLSRHFNFSYSRTDRLSFVEKRAKIILIITGRLLGLILCYYSRLSQWQVLTTATTAPMPPRHRLAPSVRVSTSEPSAYGSKTLRLQ
jgi:hypothetical protein